MDKAMQNDSPDWLAREYGYAGYDPTYERVMVALQRWLHGMEEALRERVSRQPH